MPDCHAWATENVDFYICYQIVLINYFTVFRYYRDDEEESLSTISFNFRKKNCHIQTPGQPTYHVVHSWKTPCVTPRNTPSKTPSKGSSKGLLTHNSSIRDKGK